MVVFFYFPKNAIFPKKLFSMSNPFESKIVPIQKKEQEKESEEKFEPKIGHVFSFPDQRGILRNWKIVEIEKGNEMVKLESWDEKDRLIGGMMSFSKLEEIEKNRKKLEERPRPGNLVFVKMEDGRKVEAFLESVDKGTGRVTVIVKLKNGLEKRAGTDFDKIEKAA